jgi:hypothetical protein
MASSKGKIHDVFLKRTKEIAAHCDANADAVRGNGYREWDRPDDWSGDHLDVPAFPRRIESGAKLMRETITSDPCIYCGYTRYSENIKHVDDDESELELVCAGCGARITGESVRTTIKRAIVLAGMDFGQN